jgi:serine/threonine-protein kinase
VEHGGIEPISFGARLAHATIARLAFVADLDLSSPRSVSASVAVRSGGRERQVVVTVRPGQGLRADVVALPDPSSRPPGRRGDPVKGDHVGNYKILDRIGEGGMGTVYRVEHKALDRLYALKVLRARVVDRDPDAAQQFLREARLAARIRHAHIVDVFDFGYLADGRPYLVMELLEGESLADLVDREALMPSEVISIGRQLASALAAAHDVGVIHADVTPANALIVKGGVKLVDFGLARLRSDLDDAAGDFILGTPAYISPEQLRGLPATEHSDQYGLGAVLFHLITGSQPYYAAEVRALCMMHIEAPIPPIVSPYGTLPVRLAELITRCLQKVPQNRFPDMHAVVAALDEVEKVSKRRDWTKWLGR